MNEYYMSPIVPEDPANAEHMARIWNAAMPDEFAATPRFFAYNLKAVNGGIQGGSWMMEHGQPVGFVLASFLPNNASVLPVDDGWLDVIAVERGCQRRGYGKLLIEWAHTWARHMRLKRLVLGQSIRTFFPGQPYDVDSLGFFTRFGWEEHPGLCWDVARDLGDGLPISRYPIPEGVEVRPCHADDVPDLIDFQWREFPGRWRFEYEDFLAIGGRPEDVIILKVNGRVEGSCLLTLPDSVRAIDRYHPNRLPRPWGQLGTIGVARGLRGGGLGGCLLQGGLEYLRAQGVRGCVIDWTSLVDFYGKFGFKPYHQYHLLTRSLV